MFHLALTHVTFMELLWMNEGSHNLSKAHVQSKAPLIFVTNNVVKLVNFSWLTRTEVEMEWKPPF